MNNEKQEAMYRPYYAGRFLVNFENSLNYKQIISTIIYNARKYKSDYILFNTNTSSLYTFAKEFLKAGIKFEQASENGESLIIIKLDDDMLNSARNYGITIY